MFSLTSVFSSSSFPCPSLRTVASDIYTSSARYKTSECQQGLNGGGIYCRVRQTMVRRGLSLEEKREKILGIYHSTKKIYNLKEIEKAASKQGVTSVSVKEVNQSLVDDGLVDLDKIGAANFFWSFPSKAAVAKQNIVDSLKRDIAKAEENTAANKRKICELEEGRADTEDRREKLGRLQEDGRRLQQLESEYETLKENDPAELQKIVSLTQVCKDGVNRWTDNTWEIKSWMVKKKGLSGKDVDKYLQIKGDFDNV